MLESLQRLVTATSPPRSISLIVVQEIVLKGANHIHFSLDGSVGLGIKQ